MRPGLVAFTDFASSAERRASSFDRNQPVGGFGQLALVPVPSFGPLPGAVALPEPSRKGVPVEFGLPRLLSALPDPSWSGVPWPGPERSQVALGARLAPRLAEPLPPGPRAKDEALVRRPALMKAVMSMIFVFMDEFEFA